MRTFVITAAIAASLSLGAGSTAWAGPVTVAGTGSGEFDNNLGGIIIDGGERILWGAFGTSSLTAVTVAFGEELEAGDSMTGVTVGALDWFNAPSALVSPLVFTNYFFNIEFSSPDMADDDAGFFLTIDNTLNPTSDEISGSVLSGIGGLGSLSFAFSDADLLVDNFRFELAEGDAASFTGGVWENPEHNLSRLNIVADFSSTAEPADIDMPEPATLALLGAGLAGIGIARRRGQSA